MSKAVVSIPIYKDDLNEFEKISLVQCCKILNKYKFSLICPEKLNIEEHIKVLDSYNINYEVERFKNDFFDSVEDYNRLMLDVNFYKRFIQYDYMLIYQLDAYVFKDDLDFWCEKNYDYIGAPWFDGFSSSSSESKMIELSGNGGFSLRKIDSFISVLNRKRDIELILKKQNTRRFNEDVFFSLLAKEIKNDFKVATSDEAMFFSFECQPRRLYEITNKKLPFGCHGWERYDFSFWREHINLEDVNFEVEIVEILKNNSKLRKTLEQKNGMIDELIIKSKIAKDSLIVCEEKVYNIQKELTDYENRLSIVYASREWKVALKIQRIYKLLLPKNSRRRKILLLVLKYPQELKKFLNEKKLKIYYSIEILFYCWKPKKNRKANNSSKKIVYIDHSYHNKTKSTDFFLEYLRAHFDVTVISDDSWKEGVKFSKDLSFIDDSYLGVIFFQLLPDPEVIEKIKNDNLIYVPMYDQSGRLEYEYWRKYRKLKMINFSYALHEKLKRWGFESLRVQYFPEFKKFEPGKNDEVFFWQRLTKMNIDLVEKLLGNYKLKLHIHKVVDPYNEFKQPSKEQEIKYEITYSEWFDTREEMWNFANQKGIYIAPREYEGIGLSFLEAMAMGKAVIAVNNPTMNEYIEHGKTGYLFDLNNPEAIDLSNLDEVQKNTYEYMKDGYEKWHKDKAKITDFIIKV